MSTFTTYQSKLRDGLPSRDDAKWVEDLLGKFMNLQTALFMRWLDIQLPSRPELRRRLLVITPLRIILIKSKTFGRSVHKKYRIIDIVAVHVDDTDSQRTSCQLMLGDFSPELSISRSREALKNNSELQSTLTVQLPKDIDREFLDILQWSLFIVTRGVPVKFKPKIDIPKTFSNEISDPVGPGQFIIDRYVAFCDAQTKNSGAGVAASESLIEYVLGTVDGGVFDVKQAFPQNSKKIDPLQFVCLSHGLSFCSVYKKLVVPQLASADDTNVAILMTLFETNHAIETLEFRGADVQTKTMRCLSWALSCTNGLSELQELNLLDLALSKNMVIALSTGLSYIKLKVLRATNCGLNKTAAIQLFNALQKSEQYRHLTHLNLSKNQCARQGTKCIAGFLQKCAALQVCVAADAQLDGNEFFPALTTESHLDGLSHCDTLTLLDFSGNFVGDRGAILLSNFLRASRCLNFLKLARCGLTPDQLQKIFNAAMQNTQGLTNVASKQDGDEYDAVVSDDGVIRRRPTHAEIMLCTNLLSLSLDLSDNALGPKGCEVFVSALRQRENYTIVSLNVARNNFSANDLPSLIHALKSLACLERLNVSDNVKRGLGKKSDKDGAIGKALLHLLHTTPTLNEVAIAGSERDNTYLEVGLHTFVSQLGRVSNLEFLDVSGNKLGDKQLMELLQSLQRNRHIRLLRCDDNKPSTETLCALLSLLASHTTMIDKVPSPTNDEAMRRALRENKKKVSSLREAARANLRANKREYNLERSMMQSLSRAMRLEKELRKSCGAQFGVPAPRVRGTVRIPDYASRIPCILVKLRDLLSARGGFETLGVFRLQPDAKEFPVVKSALDANDFEFRIADIHCIANAIKVWFRDMPTKVLACVPPQHVMKCATADDAQRIVEQEMIEPYKSLLAWLLDLAVAVNDAVQVNQMDAKNMAVVLCPNLYDMSNEDGTLAANAMQMQQALLRFTELAILYRIEYRKQHPPQKIDDTFALQLGVAPGINDQNALAAAAAAADEEDDDDEDDEERTNGDALFAAGSRMRMASVARDNDEKDDGRAKIVPPGPAFVDDEKTENRPENAVPVHHSVKSMAAKLAINPAAMLPGAKPPPKKPAVTAAAKQADPMEHAASMAKPTIAKKRKKGGKNRKNKQALLESMVDNYDDAAASSKARNADQNLDNGADEVRRPSRHIPMESKVLGGFVQPGFRVAMLATAPDDADAAADADGGAGSRNNKKQNAVADVNEGASPSLAHLQPAPMMADDEEEEEEVEDKEEQVYSFDTKPMGFQIEAENGKISVRSVRSLSTAGQYGIQEKWDIVAVNGFRDWSSMLGILESSLGPFSITFAVPVTVKRAVVQAVQQTIAPMVAADDAVAVDANPAYANAAAANGGQHEKRVISVTSIDDDGGDDAKLDDANKMSAVNMLHRNSSAIAKHVLSEYDVEEAEVRASPQILQSCSHEQRSEMQRLENEIQRLQTKNAQLLETLQVIRLKGEMERIELDNAKKVQAENDQLKRDLNSEIAPLRQQLMDANKQSQTQRQLMYQYANLLRRHKIPIPELQASLEENESSTDSDESDSDSE